MKILLTNDDGVFAPGIMETARFLTAKDHEVLVVAPEKEMSAISQAITLHKPLRIKKIDQNGLFECYSVSGTPADCVKIALDVLSKSPPDWLISGINNGSNLGTDISYSGTVSAAMEGSFHKIPSIAISAPYRLHGNYESILHFFYDSIFMPLFRSSSKGLYNVNFPHEEPFRDMKITELGFVRYANTFNKRVDPRGNVYYWLAGETEANENNPATDIHAFEHGCVSLTPLKTDLTDYGCIEKLNKLLI